jgi:hypothetical protein
VKGKGLPTKKSKGYDNIATHYEEGTALAERPAAHNPLQQLDEETKKVTIFTLLGRKTVPNRRIPPKKRKK